MSSAQNNQLERPAARTKYKIEPLLIRDLVAADTSNKDFTIALRGLLTFRQCIIYGRIVSCSFNKACKTYTVDDGTGRIDVAVFRNEDTNNAVRKMKQGAEKIEQSELKESIRRLLFVSERLLDVFNLLHGTRIIVLGRLKVYREQLGLTSDNLYVDDGIDRKLEIAFKNFLIERYTELKQSST